MKKYFHKLTAMLLAAAIAIPMVPPVTAYAADSLDGLKVTRENHDEDSALEYVYQFDNVTVGTTGMQTMIIENASGKVIKPDGYSTFVEQGYSVNDDSFLCVSVPAGGNVKAYLEAVKFVNDTPDISSVRVLFVKGALTGNANANMGYWNGHYYEYITEADAIAKLISNYKASHSGMSDAQARTALVNAGYIKETSSGSNTWEITWTGAREAARKYKFLNMNGYLATLVFKEEQAVVVNKLNGASAKAAWIGGHYVGPGSGNGYTTVPTGKTNGWYWVTETDDSSKWFKFLDGGPNTKISDGKTYYLYTSSASGGTPGTYAAGYGIPVGDTVNGVTSEPISYWSNEYIVAEVKDGDTITTPAYDVNDDPYKASIFRGKEYTNNAIKAKAEKSALRSEPNNSSGLHATAAVDPKYENLAEYCMQVTSSNMWNDLVNDSATPVGIFVEYNGVPVSSSTIAVVDAQVGAADIRFNLNNATASITSGNEAAINTQTVVVTNAIGNNKVTKPGLTETTLTSTDASEFSGKWYKDAACTQEWDFKAGVDNTLAAAAANREIVLYAGWISNPKVAYVGYGDGKPETMNNSASDVFDEGTTVTIDPNGGSGTYSVDYYTATDVTASISTDTSNPTTVTMNDSGDVLTLGNPDKNNINFTFVGWKQVDDNDSNDKTVTYQAQWRDNPSVTFTDYDNSGNESTMYFPKNADVTFIMNGATTNGKYWYSSTSSKDITDNGKMDPFTYNDKIELDDPAKTNYVFKGWDLVLVEIVDDVPKYTFTAMWEAHPVATYDKYVNNTTNATPIDAAAFAANSVTVTLYLNENVTETGEANFNKTVTGTYSVDYAESADITGAPVSNGGTISLNLKDKLTLGTPSRADGADFAGWTPVDNGATATFTANWVEKGRVDFKQYNNTITGVSVFSRFTDGYIYVDLNGCDSTTFTCGKIADGSNATQEYSSSTEEYKVTLPASVRDDTEEPPYKASLILNDPTWEGRTFNGWSLNDRTFTANWGTNTVVTYTPAGTIGNVPNPNTADLKDVPVNGKLHIDLNAEGAAVGFEPPAGATALTGGRLYELTLTGGSTVAIGDATRDGYAFLGWKHTKPGEVLPDNGGQAEHHTLTAQWAENAIVAYGAANPAELTRYQDDTFTLDLNIPDGESEKYKAEYDNTEYTSASDTITITMADKLVDSKMTLATPEWTGSVKYTFMGWTYANRTFTAQWAKNATVKYLDVDKYGSTSDKYTTIDNIPVVSGDGVHKITVNAKGGTCTVGSQTAGTHTLTMSEGASYTVGEATLTGYTFMGWKYEESINTLTAMWQTNPAVKYHAETTPDTYYPSVVATNATTPFVIPAGESFVEVTINKDNGTSNETVQLEEGVTVTLDIPVKENHTFTGWNLSGNTFKATWEENPVVTYTSDVKGLNGSHNTTLTTQDIKIGETYFIDGVKVAEPMGGVTATTISTPSDKADEVFVGYRYDADTNNFISKWEPDTNNDNVPDRYQKTVTFAVENGKFAENEGTPVLVTLTENGEENGIWSETGKATVTLPTQMTANVGFKENDGWKYVLASGGRQELSDNPTTAEVDKDRLNLVFVYLAADKEIVNYVGTDRTDSNSLAKAETEQLLYNGKILLIYNETYTQDIIVEERTGDQPKQEIPTPEEKHASEGGYMPEDMDFFMGWVPVTPIPDGYEYALKATWDKDEIDAVNNATTGGDDVPDSYQAAVTFKVEGGIFDEHEDVKEFVDYVTLTTNGVWDKDGTATVTIPTDMKNDAGYNATGSWDKDAMNAEGATTVEVKAGDVLTYTFTKKASSSSSTPVQKEEVLEDPDAMSGAPAPKIPEQLVEEHISYITGYEDGTVRPENKITRAEVATILYNLLTEEMKAEYATHENDFTDVPEHMWFNMPISTLVDMNLLSGYDDGTFAPNKYITRAEMAAILARFQVDVPLKDDVAFDDVDSSWAKDQIMLVARRGWINGYPDGTFRPNAHITRAETMAMINNMLHRNPQTLDDLHENVKYWEDNNKQSDWYYIHVQEATKTHTHDRNEHGFEIRG